MRIRSLKSFLAMVAAMGAALSFAQEQHTMYGGEKYPMQQLKETFKAEQQHPALKGDKLIVGDDGKPPPSTNGLPLEGAIFTMNDSGTLGYYILADTTIDKPLSEGRVVARLTDIRLYDARKPSVDPGTKIGDRTATDEKRTEDAIEQANKKNMHKMLEATLVVKNPDGTEKKDGLITVMGNMNFQKLPDPNKPLPQGLVYFTTPDGASILMGPFADIAYSPYALQRLGNPGR
jgi:hypothetical protein